MVKIAFAAASALALAAAAAPAIAQAPDTLSQGELQWRTMFPGVEFAPAYGDWEKEAHGKFVRFAPGTTVPMHTHSGAYHGVMISGRMANLLDAGSRVAIEPGSYFYIAATRPHGHECISAEPCLFYTYGDTLWDLQLIE